MSGPIDTDTFVTSDMDQDIDLTTLDPILEEQDTFLNDELLLSSQQEQQGNNDAADERGEGDHPTSNVLLSHFTERSGSFAAKSSSQDSLRETLDSFLEEAREEDEKSDATRGHDSIDDLKLNDYGDGATASLPHSTDGFDNYQTNYNYTAPVDEYTKKELIIQANVAVPSDDDMIMVGETTADGALDFFHPNVDREQLAVPENANTANKNLVHDALFVNGPVQEEIIDVESVESNRPNHNTDLMDKTPIDLDHTASSDNQDVATADVERESAEEPVQQDDVQEDANAAEEESPEIVLDDSAVVIDATLAVDDFAVDDAAAADAGVTNDEELATEVAAAVETTADELNEIVPDSLVNDPTEDVAVVVEDMASSDAHDNATADVEGVSAEEPVQQEDVQEDANVAEEESPEIVLDDGAVVIDATFDVEDNIVVNNSTAAGHSVDGTLNTVGSLMTIGNLPPKKTISVSKFSDSKFSDRPNKTTFFSPIRSSSSVDDFKFQSSKAAKYPNDRRNTSRNKRSSVSYIRSTPYLDQPKDTPVSFDTLRSTKSADEYSTNKQIMSISESRSASRSKRSSSRSMSRSSSRGQTIHIHLYELSLAQQEEGKKRRHQVEEYLSWRNAERSGKFTSCTTEFDRLQHHRNLNNVKRESFREEFMKPKKKISLEEAEQLYQRLLAHKLKIEERRKQLQEEREARDSQWLKEKFYRKIPLEEATRLYYNETALTRSRSRGRA